MDTQPQHTVYSTGANDGLKMGLYLSAVFLLQSIGLRSMPLLLAGNLLMLGIPVYAYLLLRAGYRRKHRLETFSAIWLHGIITFLCGALVMAVVVFVYLRFVSPTFIADQIQVIASAYRDLGTAEARHMADTLDKVIEKHLLPTPISMTFGMIWLVSFAGAMLSMVIALLLKLTRPRQRQKTY